jgi:hypothetical protein
MVNYHHLYLFRHVSEEDYAFLKAREKEILEEVEMDLKYIEKVTSKEMTEFEKNKPSFGYNSRRQLLGIFLREGRLKRLVMSKEDFEIMSPIEKKVFFALRNRLEEGLEGIRLRGEDWK